MKVGVETLCAIQYMLRMMDIPISGAPYVDGDDILIIHNTSKPESILKNKCNAIAYCAIYKSVKMGEMMIRLIRSEDNQTIK